MPNIIIRDDDDDDGDGDDDDGEDDDDDDDDDEDDDEILWSALLPLSTHSWLKVWVEREYSVVYRLVRIRARTDMLNKLLLTVGGLRQYTTLSDLRLRAFAHGQESGLPQGAIQETTFFRLEPGYGHIPIPTTSCAPLLVEVDAAHIQGRALGATHRGGVAIRQ